MTRALVRQGPGCTILPAAAVREELARGALVFRPLLQPSLPVTYAMAVRRAAPAAVREAARAMGETIRSLATTGDWPGAQPARTAVAPAVGSLGAVAPAAAGPSQGWRPALPVPAHGDLEFVEGD